MPTGDLVTTCQKAWIVFGQGPRVANCTNLERGRRTTPLAIGTRLELDDIGAVILRAVDQDSIPTVGRHSCQPFASLVIPSAYP